MINSMKCAKHNVGNVFLSGFHIEVAAYVAAYIRNFDPFYTIMHQGGRHVYIVQCETLLFLCPLAIPL